MAKVLWYSGGGRRGWMRVDDVQAARDIAAGIAQDPRAMPRGEKLRPAPRYNRRDMVAVDQGVDAVLVGDIAPEPAPPPAPAKRSRKAAESGTD